MSNLEKKIKKVGRKPEAYKKLMKRKRIYKKVEKGIARRRSKELRMKFCGILAISISLLFLFSLLYNVVINGYSGFLQTQVKLEITFEKDLIENGKYHKIAKNALMNTVFIKSESRDYRRDLNGFLSKGAFYNLKEIVKYRPEYIDKTKEIWLPVSSDIDMFVKGKIDAYSAEHTRKISDRQILWVKKLEEQGLIKKKFNLDFFTSGDSREPEIAGILGGLIGSFFIIIVCMLLALPLGVMSAIYLEEFAPKNKITEFIEVNINNLAAVPSIVFGLVGLTIYLQLFGIPRSASIAGGLTLALMALPIIVIATRASIRSIPSSIKDGATALGATKLQTITHHVLPLAMPGIMTGTILSISRVIGETAPLLMIGMVAFIVDIPKGFFDAATAIPVQIYLWANSPEMGFVEKTAAAIIILLLLLLLVNSLALLLRKKFETRW